MTLFKSIPNEFNASVALFLSTTKFEQIEEKIRDHCLNFDQDFLSVEKVLVLQG